MTSQGRDTHGVSVAAVNGVKVPMLQLVSHFAAKDIRLDLAFGALGGLLDRLQAGHRFDILIAPNDGLDVAQQRGLFDSVKTVEIASTGLGVVVRSGSPRPNISTPDLLRHALLACGSIAFTDPGTGAASGLAFRRVLEKLDIVEEVLKKAQLTSGGPVGEVVAQGDAELGVQQITELKPVSGIDLLHPFPAELQHVTVYRAGLARDAAPIANGIFNELCGAEVQQLFKTEGFGRF